MMFGGTWNCLKFSDDMDLSTRIRRINNSKYRYVICLKFGDEFFTSITKLVLEVKASINSTVKENLLLYCGKFFVFGITVII